MIFNPSNPIEKQKARNQFEKLINGTDMFEITCKKIRSVN